MCFFRKRRERKKALEAEMVAKKEQQVQKAAVVEPKVEEPKPQVVEKKVEVKQEPKPAVKEEVKPVVKEEPKPVVKEELKPAVKEEVKPVKEAPAKKPEAELEDEVEEKNGAKTPKIAKYHVSQNKDEDSEFFKKWRVRKEGSTKTIKFFDTQKDAIAFAEGLAESAGSTVVIHKVDGSIRKQDYTKKE